MKLFNGNLEETILTILFQKESISIGDLIKLINTRKTKVTKQGVYRVIRKLRRDEKIIVYKSVVSLNDLWIFKLRSIVRRKARSTSLVGNLNNLREKEKISLTIKSLTHLDQVWSNVFLSIEPTIDRIIPLFLYNPHNWFILFRETTDKIHMEKLAENRRQTFLTIGGSTDSDKEIMKMIRTKDLQCSINTKIKSREYIAVLSDYLIRVRLSNRDSHSIAGMFERIRNLDDIKTELYEIDQKASSKIIVEKNRTKAKEWQKRLSRDFYIIQPK